MISANWPAPPNVRAYSTTRTGGFSQGNYAGLNLGDHVGDSLESVTKNRNALKRSLNWNFSPVWLQQTHGTYCKYLSKNKVNQALNRGSSQVEATIKADASYTDETHQICAILTADCLPILLANQQGTWVAACHAGWRGLADGVLQNTIKSYQGHFSELIAWIGPAISQRNFEVGEDVLQCFVSKDSSMKVLFQENDNLRYQFDLIGAAKKMLAQFSIATYGGEYCTYAAPQSFYSYRRDGQTGRIASLIWLDF